MPMAHWLGAEFFGTFWLVLGGCGSAVLAAGFPDLGIGFAGVALAFGLTVVTITNTSVNPAQPPARLVGAAGRGPALAVLGRAAGGRGDRRFCLQVAGRRGEGRGAGPAAPAE